MVAASFNNKVMTEAFLHYIWKYKLLEGDLLTSEGSPVVVEKAGEHNHDSGPDFFDARLTIGGIQWAGNVEIHVKASDWNLHRHNADKSYNNVILHVVYENDLPVIRENGTPMPTLVVKDNIPASVWDGYAALMQPSLPIEIPCMLRLPEVSSIHISSWMNRLLVERLQRKSADVARLLDDSQGDWESTCYWMIARYFGGKTNGFAFEMLAKLTPQKILARIKDNPFRVESMLMGQSGLLEGEFNDSYPQSLQKEYAYQQKAYQLQPMDGHLWKFFRLRPASFPTIRISQLACLISHSENLFSHLLETTDVKDLRKLFNINSAPYWQNHYRFDQESDNIPKNVGKTFIDLLIINAWVPLLFVYGDRHGDDVRKEQAFNILGQLQAENNHITRLWQSAGLKAENAAQSQAQIQLYNEYCKAHRCLDCPIGYQLLKTNK